MKLKKKQGWSVFSKPYAPRRPQEPLKTFETVFTEDVFSKSNAYCDLSEIPVSADFELKDLQCRVDVSYDNDVEIIFSKMTTKTVENTHYDAQLKTHKEALKKYEIEKELYVEELKAWSLWKAQEEEKSLQRQLKRAEDLLKKHGKKVTT